jgi:KDO2-lipid IV(A) lauroyltransferase
MPREVLSYAHMRGKKSTFLINFEYFFFRLAMNIVKILPLWLCFKIAELGGRLFFIFDRRHRNRTIQHLLHAGVVKTEAEAVALTRRNFIHFAKVGLEIFKCRQLMVRKNIAKILTISGSEKSKELFFSPDGKSVQSIVICAHFGNWEAAGQGITISSGIPLLSVMRPFDNPKIGDYINSRREGHTHEVVAKKGAVRPLLVALKKGYSIAVMADQNAGENEGVVVDFFGHPARTHSSPALLHLKTGVPILVLMPKRVSDDFKFEFILSEPIIHSPSGDKEKDIRDITQKFTFEIEKTIRLYPEQWLWAHRRWLDINR